MSDPTRNDDPGEIMLDGERNGGDPVDAESVGVKIATGVVVLAMMLALLALVAIGIAWIAEKVL